MYTHFFYGTALIPTLLSFKKGCKSLNILNFWWLSLKLQSVLKKKRKKGTSWLSSQHFMFARSEQTVGELWLRSLGVTLTFSPFLLRNTSTVRRSSIDTILSSLTVSSNLKCRKKKKWYDLLWHQDRLTRHNFAACDKLVTGRRHVSGPFDYTRTTFSPTTCQNTVRFHSPLKYSMRRLLKNFYFTP